MCTSLRLLTFSFLLAVAPCALAEDSESKRVPVDLRASVDAAVTRAGAWLKARAATDGSFPWSVPDQRSFSLWSAPACDQGLTSLAALALVRAGVSKSDPSVVRAIEFLRRAFASGEPAADGGDARTFTYAAGSLLWMLSELRPSGFDDIAVQAAVAISSAADARGEWGYFLPRVTVKGGYVDVLRGFNPWAPPDLSNAQFAMLGLLSADRLGVWRGEMAWARVRDGLRGRSSAGTGFGYRHDAQAPDLFKRGRRVTTAIAAANLYVALRRTGASRDEALADPTLARSLGWLVGHPYRDAISGKWAMKDAGDASERLPYYEMIAMERLGSFTALTQIGGADWYRVGVASLLALQKPDGSWPGGVAEAAFMNATQNTVLSILFLTRALDDVPVVSPDFTTADFLINRDLAGALFDDVVGRGAQAHAAAVGESRLAWQRAYVTVGERTLSALVRIHAEGPATLVLPVHALLVALTGFRVDADERSTRTLAWTRWLFDRRGRLKPSPSGESFVTPDEPPR